MAVERKEPSLLKKAAILVVATIAYYLLIIPETLLVWRRIIHVVLLIGAGSGLYWRSWHPFQIGAETALVLLLLGSIVRFFDSSGCSWMSTPVSWKEAIILFFQ